MQVFNHKSTNQTEAAFQSWVMDQLFLTEETLSARRKPIKNSDLSASPR
jgi:hypothetical protein